MWVFNVATKLHGALVPELPSGKHEASVYIGGLRKQISTILTQSAKPDTPADVAGPHVIVMVGANGVGKTTTTAKLALHYKSQGKNILLAACDTYRAAATEQLTRWSERLDMPLISAHQGADAAAVAHDAHHAAIARHSDILIIDSAGRQHTNENLMEQLSKLIRVLSKQDASAPHEIILVLDATTGQNALLQFENFNARAAITGICLTKMDGSAKGGVAIQLAEKFSVPIKFIGVGESLDDLAPFDINTYVDALVPPVLADWDRDSI